MVGRAAELELFTAAMEVPEPPFVLLHLHGPGGVGKTTLLEAFRDIAEARNVPHALVDGRQVDPSPVGFRNAVSAALPSSTEGCQVLLIDTFECRLAGDGPQSRPREPEA